MALQRGQAWLTCVTRDEAVTSALVLAESLRRTKTTRQIGAIYSGNLSKEAALRLRKSFDVVFLLDNNLVSTGKDDELRARVFAFSLGVFEKCIFLTANTVVLENCDKLFDERIGMHEQFSGDWEMFRFTPNLEVCQFFQLKQHCNGYKNGRGNAIVFMKGITAWLENNVGGNRNSYREIQNEVSVMKFSLESGSLLLSELGVLQPIVAQLIDAPASDMELVAKLLGLQDNPNLGLSEKAIIREWLNIFEHKVIDRKLDSIMESMVSTEFCKNEPIAIIGMSCRFPGANNLEEFWNLLYSGEEGIVKTPPFRWIKEHTIYSRSGRERNAEAGFLKTPVDEFDSKFFGLSPKDAELLDPQARLLHEVLWESLENAGIDPRSLRESHTGIYTGSWMNDYKDILQRSTERDFFRGYMGNSIGATAARLSFLLGLTGPSIATESGCSSAIVAVDLAVKSLRQRESNMAIACGVNLLLHPFDGSIIEYVVSPNGRCKTFDEAADGFGRAEGCGVLVLKRLSDALRDRDNIWAVIRGSAVSQEGISRSLGTPTVHCEALAMELALKDGGVRPEQVSFVETHGTGTAVGDPMEVAAIAKAYYSEARSEPLIIGSVKTNVGHTESCSGITGIIKTVLALQNELIPKHLNLKTLNPEVKLEKIPAQIPLEPIEWKKIPGHPRLAGVSSFGITGTDGHVVIEEAPDNNLPKFTIGLERPLHLIKFSAKTNEALDEMLNLYGDLFKKEITSNSDKQYLANAAYTANTGRASFAHRAFFLATSLEDAVNQLEKAKVMRGEISHTSDVASKVCFLFTGQGSQYPGMGKLLYETSPVFRLYFDQCDAFLKMRYNLSIGRVLWENDTDAKELSQTIYSQVSIFVIEYCLFKLWESWGIKPDYVLGHSLGEFCAAVAAGILTFEDALMLVVERSLLINNLPGGGMLVIRSNLPEVMKTMKLCNIILDVAAVNSNDQTVVAGDSEKIAQFADFCKTIGTKCTILEASHAFHSHHMDPILKKYQRVAESVPYHPIKTNCQFISGMKGKIVTDVSQEINAEYWVSHTREKVSFLDACKALRELECVNYIELGPSPILSSFIMQNIEDLSVLCYPSMRRNTNDWESILTSLGRLYLNGFKINWEGYDRPYIRRKVTNLPFYPLNRKSFWVDCHQANTILIHPLVGHTVANATAQHIFQNDVNVKTAPYLKDHCIGHMVVYPGAAFTEMCMAAGYCVANTLTDSLDQPTRSIALEDLRIEAPLEIKDGKFKRMQTVVNFQEAKEDEDASTSGFECKVYHHNENEEADTGSSRNWVLHASAKFLPFVSTITVMEKWNKEKVVEMTSTLEANTMESFYKTVDNIGLKFGEHFRALQKYWYTTQENGLDEVVAEMKCPEEYDKYIMHPLLIDTMMQAAMLCGFRTQASSTLLRVPVRIGKLTLLNSLSPNEIQEDNRLYLHSKWDDVAKCTVFLCTSKFTPIAVLEDLELIETTVKTIQSVLEQQNSKIPDSWEEVWKPIAGPLQNRLNLVKLEPLFAEEEFQERIKATEKYTTAEDWEQCRKVNRLVYLYTLKALLQLGWKPEQGEKLIVEEFLEKYKILPNHARQVNYYFRMFEEETEPLEVKRLEENDKEFWRVEKITENWADLMEEEIEVLERKLAKEEKISAVVEIYRHFGTKLADILVGEASALNILFPVESDEGFQEKQKWSAQMYYYNYPGRRAEMERAREIIKTLVTHTFNSNKGENGQTKKIYRVLEVGAGTAALTEEALIEFRNVCQNQFEYWFTDISAAFFAKAEKRFDEYKANLKFSTFNVEEAPLDQGIPVNYFDIVLAADVIHATRSLRESLRNVRHTMRPGGTLFLSETLSSTKDKGITFVFGLLDGYWLFQDGDTRKNHCCVSGETWRRLLLESEFSFVHVSEVHTGILGCITGGASEMEGYKWRLGDDMLLATAEKKRKWLLFLPEKDMDLGKVEKAIEASGGGEVTVLLPEPEMEDEKLEAKITNLLSDGNIYGLIYGWGLVEKEMKDQKKIALPFLHICKNVLNLQKPPKVYVLTMGVHGITETLVNLSPTSATLFGMTKSLKNESSEMLVRYIDLDGDREAQTDEILYELAMTKETREKERVQVAYRDGLRYEPRFNRAMLAQNPAREDLQLPPCSERYGMVLPESRMINDVLYDVIEEKPVDADQVEVAVKAYSLNFRDIITILKPTKDFESLNNVGVDFAGVVTKVGENVEEDKIKVGDRVFGLKFEQSSLPSHFVVPADRVLKIPKEMTLCEASTIPAVFATSIYCLITVGQMKKGDTILIHTASGGVGLSAIQLAKHIGANIITTAGNPRKRAYLRGLGIKHVFHSRDTSYQENIMRVTNGKGVDLVLNSITGKGFKEATLAVCAENARFVEMSKLSTWTVEEVKEMRPDVQYTLVDLTKLDEPTWKKLLEDVKAYMKEGKVSPIPFMQYDALRVRQALQYFQKAKHIGKLVVTMPEQKVVGGEWKVKINMFNEDGVYVITGGLGGIGFEVCKWMLEKGATDIVLVGRSAPKPEVAREIERLNKNGVYNVRVKLADVGDEEQCKAVFDYIAATGEKPVRGVHHCAGILKDNLYTNQTWVDFEATFNPKVKGTWNLHNLTLGMPIEHFVLYSSVTAMAGTPGQANHVAANCFEDAFAHYRYSLGLPATAINWGQWAQVGVAREMNLFGVLPVSVKRMLNGLEEAMRSQRLQVAFGEFESLSSWTLVCPSFKYYLDERLWRMMLKDAKGSGSQLQLKSDKFWSDMDEAEEREDKMEVVMTYMKAILREALRMEPDEPISSDANMRDLGVDSLMLIELKNSIQSLLGSRLTVSANMLKDCQTIRQLAATIVAKIYEDNDIVNKEPLSSEEFLELLQSDCVLEESVQPPTEAEGVSSIKTVLVTGATGQLGPYVISALNKVAPQLEKIVCLVRARKGECPREKLEKTLKSMNLLETVDMNKVECVGGSVQMPNFSLEEEKYTELAGSIDCVVHLAVKSNHVESYRKSEKDFCGTDLRSVCVGGTLNILKFASTVKTKHIFYASSLLAILGEGEERNTLCDKWPEAEQMNILAKTKATGYPTSKYVSEMLLKQAVDRGIPCKAFRFPWILGNSQTGQLNHTSNHYILRFVSYLKVKAMPETAMPAIVLPVDICANLSLKIFWNEEAPNEPYNIAHPSPQLEVEFVQVAKEDFGISIELVDWRSKEWVEKLYANGMPLEVMKEIYANVDKAIALAESKDFKAVEGYLEYPESFFKNNKVQKFAPNFSQDIVSTMDIIRNNLKYVKSQGFLDKFGL